MFPISRDPPEGGTIEQVGFQRNFNTVFPISRDPPEGGTVKTSTSVTATSSTCFQFLGIPPKGEHPGCVWGEVRLAWFPISRDPPEGGTRSVSSQWS